jgi:hypothetical protein
MVINFDIVQRLTTQKEIKLVVGLGMCFSEFSHEERTGDLLLLFSIANSLKTLLAISPGTG